MRWWQRLGFGRAEIPADATPAAGGGKAHEGRYYVLDASLWRDGIGPGLEFTNEARLILPGRYTMELPDGRPDPYPERPQLRHVPEEGGPPRDFEIKAGIWIITDPLKRIFERVDPQGFAFADCDYLLPDGSPGPRRYLCAVVRMLDALDVPASRVKVKPEWDFVAEREDKVYSVLGGGSLVFRPEIVGDAHVFIQDRLGTGPICDRVMFDALTAAKLDGVQLRDVAAL